MRKTVVSLLTVLVLLFGAAQASIFNARCETNEECHKIYNPHYECTPQGNCMREHFSYKGLELGGFLMIIIVSMITNAGGVGAGTIIIPAYIVFFDFVSSDAIPLSRITIFAGSLVNYILNWTQRDPHNEKRFLINYNLASIMMPLLLAGTQVGVIFSRFLPAAAITFILVFYLTTSVRQMYQRAKKDTAKELELIAKLEESHNQSIDEGNHNSVKERRDSTTDNVLDDSKTEKTDDEEEGKRQTKHDKQVELSSFNGAGNGNKINESQLAKLFYNPDDSVEYTYPLSELIRSQWENFISIMFSFTILLLSAIARGGEGRPSIFGFEACSAQSWLVFIVTQVLSLALAVFCYIGNRSDFQEEDREIKDPTELEHRIFMRKKLLWASYTTGILAGLLGVGGGMILGLYMLSLGVDAHLSTALSTFVVLFSSAATTFQFIVAGAIHMRHAYMFMFLSLIGSLIGNLILKAILKKYKRPSVLIWILFGVLCIATGVLPIEMALNIARKSTSSLAFGSFC